VVGAVREVEYHRRKLIAAFGRAQELSKFPDLEELQADYARHLCVLVSGFIERAVTEIILTYAQGKAPAPLRSFIETSLKRLTNVDKERLLNLVGSLDAGWRTQLESYVVDERQAAINSIVGLRNDIAHGGGGSVSLSQVEKYWVVVQEVIEKVEQLILGDPRPTAVLKKR
jgi:hypothetical protein